MNALSLAGVLTVLVSPSPAPAGPAPAIDRPVGRAGLGLLVAQVESRGLLTGQPVAGRLSNPGPVITSLPGLSGRLSNPIPPGSSGTGLINPPRPFMILAIPSTPPAVLPPPDDFGAGFGALPALGESIVAERYYGKAQPGAGKAPPGARAAPGAAKEDTALRPYEPVFLGPRLGTLPALGESVFTGKGPPPARGPDGAPPREDGDAPAVRPRAPGRS